MTARAPATRHLGLDLGATNVKWTVVEHDGSEWRTLDRGQNVTNVAGAPDLIVRQLGDIGADAVERWPGVSTAGVGLPGVYDPNTGKARFLANLGAAAWMGHAVAGPISTALALPVALINDARAFGLAELRLGAGRDARSMVGVALGTGVGGVVALDGRVYHGRGETAGEIGHMTVDPNGPDCNCGDHGCLEAFVRADRIVAACRASSVEDAVERAGNGDETAIEGLRQAGRYLGIGIANVVILLSVDRVVIGGGVARAGELILATAREEVQRRVKDTPLDDVQFVTAELGTWAGATGAAIHGAEVAISAP